MTAIDLAQYNYDAMLPAGYWECDGAHDWHFIGYCDGVAVYKCRHCPAESEV